MMEIKKWGIRIVNIHRSGYYAPIILIHKHRHITNNLNVFHINSVLYNAEIKRIMEQFRSHDMHAFFSERAPEKINTSPSLFYSRRCISSCIPTAINLSFAKVDRDGQYLKFKEG